MNMKQLFLTLSLLVGFTVAAQAQQHKCGLDAAQKALVLRNPNYAQELDALKQATRAIANTQPLEDGTGRRTPQAVLTIPVVFHIIHSGEAIGTGKNISLARIQQQVAQLNADYSKTNSDISQIPAQFSGIAANCEVQFCLAAITPTGAATTGVTRDVYSNIPTLNYIESTIKPATTWNANRYLNVWVCAIPDDGSGGQTLGYAYLPSNKGTAQAVLATKMTVLRIHRLPANRILRQRAVCAILHQIFVIIPFLVQTIWIMLTTAVCTRSAMVKKM
jgi:hypothetical protein